MTMGTGALLLAIGAILRFAVNDNIQSVELPTPGLILMIAGAATFAVGAIHEVIARRRLAVAAQGEPPGPSY